MAERAPGDFAAAVVITNHNYERFVGAAITSALEQTVPCQVIVVDDGSTDRSRTVIEELAGPHPGRVQVITKANGGQASAFNAGWAEVSAPVVFFLDGDDVLDPSAVEQVTARFAREPGLARCQFRLRWIDRAGRTIPGGFPEPDRALPAGDFRPRLGRNPDDIAWQPTSGGGFASAVLDRLLPMPEEPYRISADHYLSNLAALYGPVGAIETELGGYRVHGDNADHRSRFDLGRAREILTRTGETHRHLIEQGRASGVPMPESSDGFCSLTTAGLRLVSLRLDRGDHEPPDAGAGADEAPGGRHPFPGDRRWRLVGRALAAAWNRTDFPAVRRLLAMGWVVGAATMPRPVVESLASRALTR